MRRSKKNIYSISAIKRTSKALTVYSASIPFPFAAQSFNTYDSSVPPEERAQRTLNQKHASRIRNYIFSNENYYLPPLVVAVSGDIEFVPFKDDSENGTLKISMNAVYDIIDGQHRTKAIKDIIQNQELAPDYQNEHISVDFLVDVELRQAQTYFRLLNDTAKGVSKNLTIIYDDNPLSKQIHKILSEIPLFSDKFVEKEKTNLPLKSEKFFVYKWLYSATQRMKPGLGEEFDSAYCTTFWTTLIDVIPQWKQVYEETMIPQSVREQYICSHGSFIDALGDLGKQLVSSCQSDPFKIRDHLFRLSDIDWSKTNKQWENKVIDSNGKMLSRYHNRQYLVSYLLQIINPSDEGSALETSAEEIVKEKRRVTS
ncbi:DGQHR domain-containing protein [Brasilonema sp. CT11]|nr:DGQHR domain-containing protein [Brasilonema sp. CT11]